MKRKINCFSILGMLVGAGVVVAGILLLGSASPAAAKTGVFGADFYTYINDNVAAAVSAIGQLSKTLATCFGWGMISLGALAICGFGRALFTKTGDAKPEPQRGPVPAPAEPPQAPEQPTAPRLPQEEALEQLKALDALYGFGEGEELDEEDEDRDDYQSIGDIFSDPREF